MKFDNINTDTEQIEFGGEVKGRYVISEDFDKILIDIIIEDEKWLEDLDFEDEGDVKIEKGAEGNKRSKNN